MKRYHVFNTTAHWADVLSAQAHLLLASFFVNKVHCKLSTLVLKTHKRQATYKTATILNT